MPDNLRLIDTVVTNLDRITVCGINNMSLIIESLNALGALRQRLEKEGKPDVSPDAK